EPGVDGAIGMTSDATESLSAFTVKRCASLNATHNAEIGNREPGDRRDPAGRRRRGRLRGVPAWC
ncbi:MAG: hypothetical protein VXU42_07180, partial [Verrucomicrobiota bacterium]|nr:hypothetical protein [Verrucomicrobiota bacterium]